MYSIHTTTTYNETLAVEHTEHTTIGDALVFALELARRVNKNVLEKHIHIINNDVAHVLVDEAKDVLMTIANMATQRGRDAVAGFMPLKH